MLRMSLGGLFSTKPLIPKEKFRCFHCQPSQEFYPAEIIAWYSRIGENWYLTSMEPSTELQAIQFGADNALRLHFNAFDYGLISKSIKHEGEKKADTSTSCCTPIPST